MLLYFEFEDRRRRANVTWPQKDEDVIVHLLENELQNEFPSDLYFYIAERNKVEFTIEDSANGRLIDLQNSIKRRLQELVQK